MPTLVQMVIMLGSPHNANLAKHTAFSVLTRNASYVLLGLNLLQIKPIAFRTPLLRQAVHCTNSSMESLSARNATFRLNLLLNLVKMNAGALMDMLLTLNRISASRFAPTVLFTRISAMTTTLRTMMDAVLHVSSNLGRLCVTFVRRQPNVSVL